MTYIKINTAPAEYIDIYLYIYIYPHAGRRLRFFSFISVLSTTTSAHRHLAPLRPLLDGGNIQPGSPRPRNWATNFRLFHLAATVGRQAHAEHTVRQARRISVSADTKGV